MSLFNDVINQVVGGATKHLHVGSWDGSFDGHPHSVTVDNTATKVDFQGKDLVAEFHFSVPVGFSTAGTHVLKGVLTLPNTTKSVDFDGTAITNGHIIVLGHTHGGHPRVEIAFKFPVAGDANNHYRFDADFSVT